MECVFFSQQYGLHCTCVGWRYGFVVLFPSYHYMETTGYLWQLDPLGEPWRAGREKRTKTKKTRHDLSGTGVADEAVVDLGSMWASSLMECLGQKPLH